MKFFQLLSVGFALLFTANAGLAEEKPNKKEMHLVKDGQPFAAIVIDRHASEQVKQAAKTLQLYIEKSTNTRLPLSLAPTPGPCIHVGLNVTIKPETVDLDTLDVDGFIHWHTKLGNFYILGRSDWGVEYGVYDFLERYLGIIWLMPGAIGEYIPHHQNLSVPLGKHRDEPAFLSRGISPLNEAFDEAGIWGQYNRLRRRASSSHGMRQLFPVTTFGESNPEFYPLIDGKRLIPPPAPRFPGDRAHYLWQPNFTAPGIVEAAADRIDSYFKENPSEDTYPLGLNDGNANFDQSEKSLARRPDRKNSMGYLDASNDYFLWANEVVKNVIARGYQDKWFGTLAYREITDPPSPEIGVHENIVPYLTQERLRWIDPALREADQQRTLEWRKISKEIGWYDYIYGASYLVPRLWPHLMQEYLQWAIEHHVRFYAAELYPNWGEGPKPWLMARLLWNPDADVDALLNQWYEAAVGKDAAPKLKAYYEIWEKFWTKDILKSDWWHGKGPYLSFYHSSYLNLISHDTLLQCDKLLEEVCALAGNEQQKIRATLLKNMWDEWYRPSVVLYQAEHQKRKEIASEQDAVDALKEAVNTISVAQTFRETLENWETLPHHHYHPFFGNPAYVNQSTLSRTVRRRQEKLDFDGTALLWQLKPWVSKSPMVKAEMEQYLNHPSSDTKGTVSAILSAAAGSAKPLWENGSFEEKEKGWKLDFSKRPFPSDYPFSDKGESDHGPISFSDAFAQSGSQSLLISATRTPGKAEVHSPATITREIPYQPGKYYAELAVYAPKGIPPTSGTITLKVLDQDGKELSQSLPSESFTTKPDAWNIPARSFTLPENEKAKTLQFSISLNLLTPLGDFDPRQQIYIDDVNIFKITEGN